MADNLTEKEAKALCDELTRRRIPWRRTYYRKSDSWEVVEETP